MPLPSVSVLILGLLLSFPGRAEVQNPGFESGLEGWRSFWTREAGTGELGLDSETVHSGKNSARIVHKGERDWSFEPFGRFVQSYKNTCPTVREVGYSEMTDHRFLTNDQSVQQTAFANGIRITVNFGNQPFPMENGITLAPLGFHVEQETAGRN